MEIDDPQTYPDRKRTKSSDRLGRETRGLAKAARAPMVRIMVEDGRGNILLQKRAPTMELFPGRWDNSCAGHVDAGESYELADGRQVIERYYS